MSLINPSLSLSEPFIRRPVMTRGAHRVGDPVRRAGVPAAAGERPAGGRLSGHPGERRLPRRQPRDDGEQRRHAARAAVHADPRAGAGHQQEHAGALHARRCSSRSTRASTPPRPTCRRRSRRRPGSCPPDLPSPPTFTKTNPNDQPIMYIALTSDTHDRRASSTTTPARRSAQRDQHHRRREPGAGLRHASRRCASRPTRRRWPRASMTMDDLAAAIQQGHELPGRRPVRRRRTRTFLLQPQGQLETRRAVQQPDHRPRSDGAPIYLKDVADGRGLASRTSASDMRFWVRGQRRARRRRVVVAVFRQAGSNAVEVAKSRAANCCRRSSRTPPGSVDDHARSTTARQTIVNSVTRREGDALHRVRPGRDRDLRLPRPRDRHADPGRRAAAVAAADVHRRCRCWATAWTTSR